MRKRECLFLLGGIVAGGLLASAWRLYSRRPLERVPSKEGIDDSAVAHGFNRMANMPQMRLLRWYVARRATGMIQRGEAVDLGCGPGQLAVTMSQLAPALHVTGVDVSNEMLDQAEIYARDYGLDNRVSFRKGDVVRIPFPDASLDLVVSTLSLHHWAAPIPVLDEIARVLRPGGAYLIFDLRRDMPMPFWLLLWFATRFVVPAALRQVNEPLGSRDAAYSPDEAACLAWQSVLNGWRVTTGPLWLAIEGAQQT